MPDPGAAMRLVIVQVPSLEAGLVAAPAVIAATAIGAGVGALAARARDGGIDDAMLTRLGDLIQGSEAVLVVLADEGSAAALDAHAAELIGEGATLEHTVVPPQAGPVIGEAIERGPDPL